MQLVSPYNECSQQLSKESVNTHVSTKSFNNNFIRYISVNKSQIKSIVNITKTSLRNKDQRYIVYTFENSFFSTIEKWLVLWCASFMSDLPCINLLNKQTETHHSKSYRILYKIYRNENNQQSTNLQIYIDGKNVKEGYYGRD